MAGGSSVRADLTLCLAWVGSGLLQDRRCVCGGCGHWVRVGEVGGQGRSWGPGASDTLGTQALCSPGPGVQGLF